MSTIDLTGQRFGRLTVIAKTDKRKNGVVWSCACECGNTTEASTWELRSGRKRSCGCLRSDASKVDIAGERFGKLVAIEPTEARKYRTVVWKCRCDCGNTCEVSVRDLRSGAKTSCGCQRRATPDRPRKKYKKVDGPRPGQRFGKLVVVDPAGADINCNTRWRCMCECERIVYARAADLLDGTATSCGKCNASDASPSKGDKSAPADQGKDRVIIWKQS